jgi:hypothetical protein
MTSIYTDSSRIHEVWKIARKVNAIDICMPPEVINSSACNISLEIGEVICCSQTARLQNE